MEMAVTHSIVMFVISALLVLYVLGAKRRIKKYGNTSGGGSLVGVIVTPVLAYAAVLGAIVFFILGIVFLF